MCSNEAVVSQSGHWSEERDESRPLRRETTRQVYGDDIVNEEDLASSRNNIHIKKWQ